MKKLAKRTKTDYDEMSDVKCSCGEFIKANLVNRKQNTINLKCFHCFHTAAIESSNPIRTAKEIRSNPYLRSQKRWVKAIPLRTALEF